MAPGRANLDGWLRVLHEAAGTDLLLTVGAPPQIRVNRELCPLPGEPPLTPDHLVKAVRAAIGDGRVDDFTAGADVDFSFNWGDVARFRGNAFHQRGAPALVLRRIPLRVPSFDDLGLPPVTERLTRLPHGLVLVTGPTGAGKSTTLASMVANINAGRACHILTIEDPIEYVHVHERAIVNQREVGHDTPAFAAALRSALREDPDVLLVGEMRDTESIQAVLTLAETGHLVLASLHTNDAAQALDRIIDVFPADRRHQIQVQLGATLQAVYYQRLVPRVGGGIVAAFEVMLGSPAVRNLVREGKTAQLRNVVATQQSEGMQTLEMSLSDLVARGIVAYEDAVAASAHPKQVARPVPVAVEPALPPPGRRAGRRG